MVQPSKHLFPGNRLKLDARKCLFQEVVVIRSSEENRCIRSENGKLLPDKVILLGSERVSIGWKQLQKGATFGNRT